MPVFLLCICDALKARFNHKLGSNTKKMNPVIPNFHVGSRVNNGNTSTHLT